MAKDTVSTTHQLNACITRRFAQSEQADFIEEFFPHGPGVITWQ